MSLSKKTLSSFLLCLFALIVIGCGDSREDFVVTQNQGNANVGNLVFNFQRAQTIDTVPTDTVSLRFDLFTTNPPQTDSLALTETRPFATQVVLTNVPSSVQAVVVTAIGSNGAPLASLGGETNVLPGGSAEVDLNDSTPITFDSITVNPDPAAIFAGAQGGPGNTDLVGILNGTRQLEVIGSFSNGSTVSLPLSAASVSFTDVSFVDISSAGLMSLNNSNPIASCGRNTTVTATYTIGNTTQTDEFLVGTNCFAIAAAVNGTRAQLIRGTTYDDGYFGTITRQDENGQLSQIAQSQITFAEKTAVQGITFNSATGEITVGAGVDLTAQYTVVGTFVDGGNTYTAELIFEILSPGT